MYNKEFRPKQKGFVSIPISSMNYFSSDKNDTLSEDIAFQYDCGWFAHPIFSQKGDYPEVMKTRILENSIAEGLPRSKLPEFDEYWIDLIRSEF